MENNTNHEIPISGILYKWFLINVTDPDKVYTVSYELDKTIGFVTGIALDSNRERLLVQRGSQRIEKKIYLLLGSFYTND